MAHRQGKFNDVERRALTGDGVDAVRDRQWIGSAVARRELAASPCQTLAKPSRRDALSDLGGIGRPDSS